MEQKNHFFTHTSNGFKVDVETEFDFDNSNPIQYNYLFRYNIKIKNLSNISAQLLTRKWHIFNERNEEKVVEGPGVVGQTPYLSPGEDFNYSSYCPLDTFYGYMYGHFGMIDQEGREFKVLTPRFEFHIPQEFYL